MNILTFRLIFSALITMTLVACGGGSGDGPDDSASSSSSTSSSSSSSSSSSVGVDTNIGVFLDSAVGGVRYSTSTQEGTTNSLGEFVYIEGEEVTFSIGGTSFPPVKAKEKVTPLDIGGDDADLGTTTVLNILRLLQTLDEDGDPENGITIAAETASALLDVTLDVTVGTFETDAADQISEKAGKELVSEEAAVAHFEGTLRGDLLGSWLYEEDTGNINILTFLDDSTYVIAHSMADDGDQTAGSVEYGRYTWDPVTGEFSVTDVIAETDASGGLYDSSSPTNSQGISARLSAGTLTLQSDDGAAEFTAVSSSDHELTGAWYLGDFPENDHVVLTVFSPTDYVIVHTSNTEAYDGEAVVATTSEWNTYVWDAVSGELQVGIPSIETDGPGGFFDANDPGELKSLSLLGNGDLGYHEDIEEQYIETDYEADFARVGSYTVELSDRDGDLQLALIKRDLTRAGNNYVGTWYFSDIGAGEPGEFNNIGTGEFNKLILEDNGTGTINYPPSEDNDFSESDINAVTWSATTSGTLRVTEVDADGEQSLRSFTPLASKSEKGVLMRTIIEAENRLGEAFILNLYSVDPKSPN